METIVVKLKTGRAAEVLTDFLKTIDYVEQVNSLTDDVPQVGASVMSGTFASSEKPSDFAGIWSKRKKVDAKKLRQKAWPPKRSYN